MTIEHLKTSDLIPYARNAKKHDASQVAKLAGSIREYGFTNPVLIDKDNGIIAGHGRVLAAQSLALESVPCIRLGHLTDTQRRAYILADNRLAEIGGGWDEEMLKLELADLAALGVDSTEIGFSPGDLSNLDIEIDDEKPVDAEPKIDLAAELCAKWGTKLGQLWELGNHRIICGDSTDKKTVHTLLNGDKPHLMVTDPPYGVEYDANWREEAGKGAGAIGKVLNDDRADWQPAWDLFPGAVAYIWHAGSFSPTVADSLIASDFVLRNLIIWAKGSLLISRGNYHHQHEPCWYAVRKGQNAKFTEDRTQTTLFKNIQDVTRQGELVFLAKDHAKRVYAIRGDKSTLWDIPKPTKSETGHSTQKPVECMARPIRNHDSEFVYEPFSGSGTTIIACEQLGRKCRAIELNPGYVAVALQRWADATGKMPKRLA
jgi:DNA modification methylase